MTRMVAIIGRPNVGKSTLFNRLVGKKLALVDDTPGVTRDRREGKARLGFLRFSVFDTAGLDDGKVAGLEARTREQTLKAVSGADVCLFVVDARAGVTAADKDIANLLRRAGKPVILVANKAESREGALGVGEASSLGFGEAIAFSAEHALGLSELEDALAPHVASPDQEISDDVQDAPPARTDDAEGADEGTAEERPRGPLKIAVIGRPNAGKSTLINTLIGEERLVTSPEAGTTRDAIAIDWTYGDQAVELFDTAGLRRRSRVVGKIEKLAVADGLRAVQFAEVVILVIDATVPFESQDLTIADLVEREGRAIVIAANKWDLIDTKQATLKRLREDATRLLPQLRGMPVIAMSAAAGQGIERLMDAVFEVYETWNKRVPTNALNRWLEHATARHPPPAVSGRRIRLRYMTQAKIRPPTFAIFGNQLNRLGDEYVRYLVNGLRESFGFKGVPLRISLRTSDNPYAGKKSDERD